MTQKNAKAAGTIAAIVVLWVLLGFALPFVITICLTFLYETNIHDFVRNDAVVVIACIYYVILFFVIMDGGCQDDLRDFFVDFLTEEDD